MFTRGPPAVSAGISAVETSRPDQLFGVLVRDGGEGRPALRPENHDATSGRGLLMVSKPAMEWGTRPLPERGKVTWAEC